MKKLIALLPLLAVSILCAHAQSWVTVGGETDVVTFNQGATYSFGALSGVTTTTKMVCSPIARNCFKSYTATAGVPVIFNSNFPDPAPGVTKSVQVLQASGTQTGSTVHNGVTTQWSVPGTTPPVTLPPVTTPPVVTPPVTTPPVTTPPVTTPPAGTTPTVVSTVVLTLSCDILSNSTLNCTLPSNFTMPVVTK